MSDYLVVLEGGGFTGDKPTVVAASQVLPSRLDFKAPSCEAPALDPLCIGQGKGVMLFHFFEGGRALRLLDQIAVGVHSWKHSNQVSMVLILGRHLQIDGKE